MEIDDKRIIEAINNAKSGIRKYVEIMDVFNSKNISNDLDFQRKFNHFYRMMRRSRDYYDDYFAYLEKNKKKEISFEKALSHFKKKFNRMEPSFSSKLVATINPYFPVWDKFVLKNLNIKAPSSNNPNRQKMICDTYDAIYHRMNKIVESNDGKRYLKLFNTEIPNVAITDIKKIDFILWQLR